MSRVFYSLVFFGLIFAFSVGAAARQGDDSAGNQSGQDDQGQNINAGAAEDDSAPVPVLYQSDGQAQNQVQNREQTENQGDDAGLQNQEQIRNVEQLRVSIQNNQQAIKDELVELKDKNLEKVYQNQNQVREAVHALLASKDLIGGIGQQVSAIAQEFDNSVKETIQAEEKIQNRNRISRVFFGGNKEAAAQVNQLVEQNRERVQELKNLFEQSSVKAEIKEIISEQIQNIESEQNRLGELAAQENNSKGVFGWLFGWLKK